MSEPIDRVKSHSVKCRHVKEYESEQYDRADSLPEEASSTSVMMLLLRQRNTLAKQESQSISSMHRQRNGNERNLGDKQESAVAMNEREDCLVAFRPKSKQADGKVHEYINPKPKSG